MGVRIKNRYGTLTGWNNVVVSLLGRELDGITEISYTDEQEITVERGAGDTPVGHSVGNYEAKASLSLLVEELRALQKSLPEGVRIQDIPAFDVIVEYEHNGLITTDIISDCRIKNNGREVKQGDGKIVQKLDLVPIEIKFG